MKKTLLALAVASLSTTAFATDISDQFSTSATAGVGGYYDTEIDEAYDDWATALTVASDYKNDNGVVGYLEVDLELNWSTDEDKESSYEGPVTNKTNADVDKAWIGYDTGFGIASFGLENDTALDKVDGAGDTTYEFGSSAGDASDQFNVIKFEGATSGVAYGISYFTTDADYDSADLDNGKDKGVNGYVGFEQDTFNVYAGYETRDEADYQVFSVSGNATFSDLKVGVNAWINDGETDSTDSTQKTKGYYVSAGYDVTEQLNLAVGYTDGVTEEDGETDVDTTAVNVAAAYTYSDAFDMGMDVKYDTENEETYVFAVGYYHF